MSVLAYSIADGLLAPDWPYALKLKRTNVKHRGNDNNRNLVKCLIVYFLNKIQPSSDAKVKVVLYGVNGGK